MVTLLDFVWRVEEERESEVSHDGWMESDKVEGGLMVLLLYPAMEVEV